MAALELDTVYVGERLGLYRALDVEADDWRFYRLLPSPLAAASQASRGRPASRS